MTKEKKHSKKEILEFLRTVPTKKIIAEINRREKEKTADSLVASSGIKISEGENP